MRWSTLWSGSLDEQVGYYGGSWPGWLFHLAAATSIRATAALRWRRTASISLIQQCRGKKKSNGCFFFFPLSVPVVLLAVVHVTPALRGCKLNESPVRDPGSRIEFSREAFFCSILLYFSTECILRTEPSALAGETSHEQFNLQHQCSLGA